MNGIGGWFHRLGAKINAGLRNFMVGRYGTDKLNMALLCAGLVLCVISVFAGSWVKFVTWLLSYVLLFWVIFRTLSRNTYKRYQENRKFQLLITRIKDREHRYYACPRCRQSVRVPRGKGKISITCPKCKEKFVKKT